MDNHALAQIAITTANRYGITLDQSAVHALQQRLPNVQIRLISNNLMEHDAVEAALKVMFIDAALNGSRTLDGHDIANILSRLCPLPPFC